MISLELLRRAQREWDRYLRRSQRLKNTSSILQDNNSGSDDNEHDQHCANKNGSSRSIQRPHTRGIPNVEPRLEVWQQVVRSLLYMLQFAVGYFVMLLAMYYNGLSFIFSASPLTAYQPRVGYIIIMIFVGAFLGALIFQWDTFEPVGTGQV